MLYPAPHPRSTPLAICWQCLARSSITSSLLRRAILPLQIIPRRFYATTPSMNTDIADLARTRNIGIIAHIDAGKTTTTERMLYYSGFTRRIGDVDEGSTVMDYLPAERSRGITITSAAITFDWTPSMAGAPPYTINLIDTPGHADFTFEVERSIRVLDGAVTILDGVAGVEAQTEKVWRQADRYGIPRLIFVNKLDRVGAKFGPTVREIASKLNAWPAVLQLPVYDVGREGGEVFRGVVDVVENRVFLWDLGGDGQKIDVHDYEWLQENRPELHAEALLARVALVELLAERDEELVEVFLDLGDHHNIPAAALKKALRKQTLSGGDVTPVLCGASFRNVGVQPLLDAVVDYLPSPLDRPETEVSYDHGKSKGTLQASDDRLCALAFKVINDPKRGAMVFVRVYSGTLNRAHHLYNTTLGIKERAHRLLKMYADDAVDIDSIPTGHIGVIIGLKQARTGDTLIADQRYHHPGRGNKQSQKIAMPFNTVQLRPIEVPPPVFFASIEPNSLSEAKPLEDALAMLLREDPSLHVSVDEDSGQTLISGMGELHLEIARDRLVGELKAKAEMGRILISYRETIPSSAQASGVRKIFDREIGGRRAKAGCLASVQSLMEPPVPGEELDGQVIVDGNIVTVETIEPTNQINHGEPPPEHTKLPKSIDQKELRNALIAGAAAALGRGPYLGFPVRNTAVNIAIDPSKDYFGLESTIAAFSSVARMATAAALEAAIGGDEEGVLMEPVMDVVVTVGEKDLGRVVNDLSSTRGGHVLELSGGDDGDVDRLDVKKVYAPGKAGIGGDGNGEARGKRAVGATVPLKEMVGYLKHLRSMTAGRGTFVMSLLGWERMARPRAVEVAKEIRGS